MDASSKSWIRTKLLSGNLRAMQKSLAHPLEQVSSSEISFSVFAAISENSLHFIKLMPPILTKSDISCLSLETFE